MPLFHMPDEIDAEMTELLADPGPPFVPTDPQCYANSPSLWTPEQRRMAGIPETAPDAGKNLPEHLRQMVAEMGRVNSAMSEVSRKCDDAEASSQ